MLKIKHTDRISNEEIYKRLGQKPISKMIIKRQLTWVGHMLRRTQEEPIRKYALYEPSEILGKAKIGRPTTTYSKHIANIINSAVRLSPNEIERAAQDRESLKKLVLACTNRF